jgi:hypothetical protein
LFRACGGAVLAPVHPDFLNHVLRGNTAALLRLRGAKVFGGTSFSLCVFVLENSI